MEQHNNKIISKITNFINKNSSETTKTYIIFTILAGILTLGLGSVSRSVLWYIDPKTYIAYINENICMILFYIENIIGFLIYFCVLKEMTKPKIIISIIAGIFMLISGFIYNTALGIGIVLVSGLCMYIYHILAFILFISYAKKFIFKKKVIITIVFIILLLNIKHYIGIQKVNDYIPSVSDFKNELIERSLYTDEYLLFGIDNVENNIHKIDFDSDSNKKYPSYIYYGYKTKNLNKNTREYDDSLNWIIYYTNGKIYAVLGQKYGDRIIASSYTNILIENDEIYTYNWEKNYYEKININKDGISSEEFEGLNYYYENGTNINIDVLKKPSNYYVNYERIDKIDSNMLDNYANNLNK